MTDEKQKDESGELGKPDEPSESTPETVPESSPEPAAESEPPAAGAGSAAETADAAKPAPRPSRLPLLLGAAALPVSIVAVLAAAWLWLSERGPDELATANRDNLETLSGRLDETRDALTGNERQLSSLRSEGRETTERLDDLERSLDESLRPLESVPGRLSSLEASLAALQGISSGVRDTWLLAEAEYYMEIANAQLELAGNPGLAQIALELADERVAKVAKPGLTDVRRALADELRALKALEAPDVEGAALTLASLADAVDSLPLANDVVPPDERDTTPDEELSGFDRAMASLRNAMSDVVSVRRADEALKPLLPPEQTYFLRSNLVLQLQVARLALLKGEQTIFEQSLSDAAGWIEKYFDTDQKPVSSALETIAELEESQTRVARPDISRSLTLLREFLAREANERRTDTGQQQ